MQRIDIDTALYGSPEFMPRVVHQATNQEIEGASRSLMLSNGIPNPSRLQFATTFRRLRLEQEAPHSDNARVGQGDSSESLQTALENMRLVAYVMRKGGYFRDSHESQMQLDDYFQVGYIALVRAANTHDEIRGALSTIAFPIINGDLYFAKYALATGIRVPRPIAADIRSITAANGHRESLGKAPLTLEETANLIDKPTHGSARRVGADDVLRAEMLSRRIESTNVLFGPDANIDLEDPLKPIEDQVTDGVYESGVGELLELLKERERYVIELRYGFDDGEPKTLAEIGSNLGLTRERIRQIEKEALDKLRIFAIDRGFDSI